MKTLYKLLAIGMVLGLAFTALPMGQASEVKAQGVPIINHGTFGGAPYARVDSNAVSDYKNKSWVIQAGGYVSDTEYQTMEAVLISFDNHGSYATDRGGSIYIQSVITGLQEGDIVEVKNDYFYLEDESTGYESFWDQDPYWIKIGNYTHKSEDTILNWLIYSEKVSDTEYRLVIGSGEYNLALGTDDLTTTIGDSYKLTRDVKVYRDETLANPTTSSRGYITSSSEDTSTWGSPILTNTLDTGGLDLVGSPETYVDDDWAGKLNGDVVDGHIFGQDAFATIQQAIDGTANGGTVNVAAGTYVETGQIVIDKNLTIIGADKATTIIKPAQDTGSSGDARGWFLVQGGMEFNLSNVTLDGENRNIYQAIRSFGSGKVDNNIIKNIVYPGYMGTGIVVMGNYPMTFSNNTLSNIGRVGMMAFGAGAVNTVIYGNTYTGKGVGDWLDYGVEIGGGAQATITGNTITNCKGVASADGSTSAGILVTTYYGEGTQAAIVNNSLTGNTTGIAVGYDGSDTSLVTATGNTFASNDEQIFATADELFDVAATLAANTFDRAVTVDHPGASLLPAIWSNIQDGIDAATPGDTINVAAGTYDEENILITKGINLIGAGATSTRIAPSAVTNNSTIKVQNPSGNVTISGFNFVMQPKPNYGSAVVVTGTGITIDSATVTISNNVVTGSNDGKNFDYGFYGQGNNAKVIIENNTINKTGDNPIVFEQQAGSTTVRNNEFHIVANPDYDPYFSMAYNGLAVSTPQIVEANRFYLDHSGTGYAEAITFDTAVLNPWNNIPSDTGHYTNILIKDNEIYTGGAYARGIGLIDRSADDGMGTISGAKITGNQIIGENLSDDETFGITLTGDIEGAIIQNNTIGNVDLGLRIRPGVENSVCPSGNDVSENKITSVAIGVKNECTSGSVDASPNWWGSITGPAAGQIVGNVTYSPWCGDAECSFFVTGVTPGETPEESGTNLQTTLTSAQPGATIYVPDGEYKVSGGFTLNKENTTLILGDGVKIQNESPCFNVTASNTKITTESIGGAVCVPTESDHGIVVNAGLTNIIVEGIEIDGTGQSTGDGIHFAGAVTDVIVRDNLIHNLGGDGVHFTAQPANYVEIKGNLFMGNAGEGVDNTNGTDIDAKYNAWGDYAGPTGTNGDGVSTHVTYDPWTHVDIYLVSSGTPWANQVGNGKTISYAVKAHMVNVNAADFVLTYDTSLLSVTDVVPGADFVGLPTDDDPPTNASLVDNSVPGELHFRGFKLGGTVNGDVTLFTVTFNATKAGNSALNFDETTDLFGMPGVGSSVNIYAAALSDGAVNVYDLPTLAIDPTANFAVRNPKEFALTVTNPETGRAYTNLKLDLDGLDATMEYWSGSAWVAYTQGDAIDTTRPLMAGETATVDFRVTFNTAGTDTATVNVYDGDISLVTQTFNFTVIDSFTVTGSVQMQGRTVRSGVPVTLAAVTVPFGPYNAVSIDLISDNLSFANVAAVEYTITTNQPRYLNVTSDLNKTINVALDQDIARLELKGGNAVWENNNEIDILDAVKVGATFGTAGEGDVNFDGKVNIQDLALVGGNYGWTSADVYESWTP